MYIGSTDQRGLHHMICEIVDNSADEAVAGYVDQISVVIRPDGAVLVRDNGRGIPVDLDPETQKPLLELVMSTWNQHRDITTRNYKQAMPPIGALIVNTLSEWARVEVRRDGQIYAQEYREGIPTGPVAAVGVDPEGRGTTTLFKPDPTIFETTDYDHDTLARRFRELSYLTRGLTITFVDQRADQERQETFYFEHNIRTWVQHLNRDYAVLHQPFYVEATIEQNVIEVALQYNDSFTERILGFANNIATLDRGTHLTGFQAALTYTLNTYARKNGILTEDAANLTAADVHAGLTAIVSVRIINLSFVSGKQHNELRNPEALGQVQRVVGPALRQFLNENPAAAQAIVTHCQEAARVRMARKKARRGRTAG
jgi:DNA gyrase subunit B